MEALSRDIRRTALQKIAVLSATSPAASFDNSDLHRLCNACPPQKAQANGVLNGVWKSLAPASQVPMSLREFEVLLALCKAAPLLKSTESAERLLRQLGPYLPESHNQVISPSPFLRDIEPSPWEALSYSLTSAVLAIGTNHPELRDLALTRTTDYLENCQQAVTNLPRVQAEVSSEEADVLNIVSITVSILGFLDAAASHANFWTATERLSLIERIRKIFTEKFLVSVETAFSTVRNAHHTSGRALREWKRYTKHYAAIGRPLGAMLLQRGFMWLVVSGTSLLIADPSVLREEDILDVLMSGQGMARTGFPGSEDSDLGTVETLVDIATEKMALLEDGTDYLQLGSAWQQRLAFAVKAYVLTSYVNCVILNEGAADAEVLMTWLEDTMADPIEMADDKLASVVLRCMAILARVSPAFASNLSRLLPRFIVRGGLRGQTVAVAANCLAYVLQFLSQDSVITTLYTLGNVLSSGSGETAPVAGTTPDGVVGTHPSRGDGVPFDHQTSGSAISLALSGEEETATMYGNVVQAIVVISNTFKDGKIMALVQSMLIQKIGKVSAAVDARILTDGVALAVHGGQNEFRSLLKLLARLGHTGVVQNDPVILGAVMKARNYLAVTIRKDSPLHDIYLVSLLETVISKGDALESGHTGQVDVEFAAREIAQLLQPLALVLTTSDLPHEEAINDEILTLCRDAWLNIVVHGFAPKSELVKKHDKELRIMAKHLPPLVAEQKADQIESDMDLNIVLRRGMSAQNTAEQKRRLIMLLPNHEVDIRSLSYPKVMFLTAAYLLESLRAESGDCTKLLTYFLDPNLRSGDSGNTMMSIAEVVMATYLRKSLAGNIQEFCAAHVARRLAALFTGCCHRIERVRQVATACVDRIIAATPSALCQKSSLFALLELLTLMWTSCLDAETDEYEWRSTFTSALGKVTIELSDNYEVRRKTLNVFAKSARIWVMRVMDIAPLDVKGLLQTYLSEYEDGDFYGHMSLGRSFALEMGTVVPTTDQRLGAIDNLGDCNINTASDFIAQYTTRQEYRYADTLPDHDQEWLSFMQFSGRRASILPKLGQDAEGAEDILTHLENRTLRHKFVSVGELRDVLRRAAALLCRTEKDECSIVHHLVGIPFTVFTKQSVKLGISLWMGVINENPRMEPGILMEIAEHWENTVRKRIGIFNDKFTHPDPFFVKQEFAPSDKETLLRRQQAAHNLIAPHLRVLQFLGSHFNATRLGSPHIQKIFYRLVQITLDGLKHTTGHPLAREVRFQIVLFSLKVLTYGTGLDSTASWRLKDQILSAALTWFSFPPRWSFGGNRLQIKAEAHLLADVDAALAKVAYIGSRPSGSLKSLRAKQDLLHLLLDNEQSRLIVWLFPLQSAPTNLLSSRSAGKTLADNTLSALLKTAWVESPALAIQLVRRFQYPRIADDVRWLLLNFPEKGIGEPDALEILLGSSLPADYLLYWAPVDPVTAATYFLPAYKDHPYIIQYAMRALESHSVDVTFFYVPQIVQTLRYDSLGYVERYIIETAKFSQLFAHQIIWNMKANMFRDEDSQIPDPLKPTLDKVMDRLICSFSETDKDFYEREFSFFNEVTDVSGKLRPYIKRSKPEKKQKIEEELRRIKVEVGVYLPSNPDGVVIGIDRKSGKPLQSHAKAPYMATFRIRKSKGASHEYTEETTENKNTKGPLRDDTVEVWQSAIFKVGDDCRQDVLALQMIAAFRGIFNSVGLDVFVYPYRVTATAPGCGVIDVLPNSISRDMLGREAVNGLYDYFTSKYGGEDSVEFQEARNNFVKSMAAYSVISYLLQFKDRHNGNIMIDDAGHILHIDFGFCFDIAPGGIKFERAPFKLTSEMVAVMGHSISSQPYHWFEEMTVKAFLASRQHTEKLVHIVLLMVESGLPCFIPQTIQHFRERFVLEKSDREAADFMRELIKKSWSSYSTKGYDQFQLLTNGIPY
ncbi:hypothetical protein GP486_003947 [Trichoglossum hirsutum]|uniref:1-phosphatidylinositol 4-kinase n=1 Tax=Trichoglossum hirsutum TaxID=265104 RepID=A0A9P8LBX2_9PEZI|nr:hypothetical protein GP486_003947 [Trichoglossum hirsutum]